MFSVCPVINLSVPDEVDTRVGMAVLLSGERVTGLVG